MAESLSAESIREIERLTTAAARTTFLQRPGDPKHVVHMVGPYGLVEKQEVEPAPLAVTLATPAELAQYSTDQADPLKAHVFYGEDGIVLVLDKVTRRDRVVCPLTKTGPLKFLEAASVQLPQKEFARTLRILLRDCLPGTGLLNLVRNIKWQSAGETAGAIAHGKESMGRSISAQVLGTDAFPEEVTLTVRLWENFDWRADVQCALEIFPHEQRFQLTPFPMQIATALEEGLAAIAVFLEDAQKAPIYLGNP